MKKIFYVEVLLFALVCGVAYLYRLGRLDIWIINSFLDNVHSIRLFVAILGGFLLEGYILWRCRGRYSNKALSGVFICVAFSVSIFVFSTSSTKVLDSKLLPGTDMTLMARIDETASHTKEWILKEYYFRNKMVWLDEHLKNDSSIVDFINQQKTSNIDSMAISKTQELVLLGQPFFSSEEYVFVVDTYWKNTEEIAAVKNESGYIFCSKEWLEDILNGKTRIEQNSSESAVQVMASIINSETNKGNSIKQISILFALYALGLFFSSLFWGEYNHWYSVFMALPFGAGVWCVSSTILTVLGIRCNILSNVLLISFILATVSIWMKKQFLELDWKFLAKASVVALCLVIVFVCLKISWMSNDSFSKAAYGLQIAMNGYLRGNSLSRATSFGLLEPFIMAIAYELKAEYLYAFYPLITICCIGMMISTLRQVHNRIWPLALGIIVMLLNADYFLGSFYAMAHGPISFYFFLFLSFIILKRDTELPNADIAIVFSGIIIVLTRIEGAVYVIALLALYLGLSSDKFKLVRAGYIMALMIIVWNAAQLIIVRDGYNTLFWTPQRGILLVIGALMLAIWSWLVERGWKIIEILKTHFEYLFLSVLCIGAIVVMGLVKPDMTRDTLYVYIAHFSNNMDNDTNAAAFWIFIFLLTPCLCIYKIKENSYMVVSIITYLMLIFLICLFRDDVPIRLGYGDSARRTIVQIMPSAIWMIMYGIENATIKLRENKGESEFGLSDEGNC